MSPYAHTHAENGTLGEKVVAYWAKDQVNKATGGLITDAIEEADTPEKLRDALYLHHDIHSFI